MNEHDVELMRQMIGHHGKPQKMREKVAAQLFEATPGARAKHIQRIMHDRFGVAPGMSVLLKLQRRYEKKAAPAPVMETPGPVPMDGYVQTILAGQDLLRQEIAFLRAEVKRLNDDLRGPQSVASTQDNGVQKGTA